MKLSFMRILNRSNYYWLELLLITALTIFTCSLSPGHSSATETDTGQIAGMVTGPDGKAIAGADVLLRAANTIQKVDGGGLTKSHLVNQMVSSGKNSPCSTITAIDGFFEFDSLHMGSYIVEIRGYDTLGALAEAVITSEKPAFYIEEIKLSRFGAIRGNIDISLVKGDSTYIYLVEYGKAFKIDSSGFFEIFQVPAFDYRIHIIAGDTIIVSPLDSIRLPVVSDDTTVIAGIGSETGTIFIHGTIQE